MPKRMWWTKRFSKKTFPEFVRSIQGLAVPGSVEFWAMDEHRIGLKPILRRVWAKRGVRPRVLVHHRYEWSYVYGFVHPPSGRTFWLLMPTVSNDAFSVALREFAAFCQLGKDKRVFLLVDRAGFHTSPAILRPLGLQLCFLPAYSPELQPAEHLWPLSNAPLVNRCFASLDRLEAVQAERCNFLQDHPDLVRSATFFHWWPSPSLS